jgi:spore maturation protein CgeB
MNMIERPKNNSLARGQATLEPTNNARPHRPAKLNIAFFGSSLLSAYRNSAATYFRGLVRALHARGHRVTFYEPDVPARRQSRDIENPPWAKVVVYSARDAGEVLKVVETARYADLVFKTSGVGLFDELLNEAVLQLQRRSTTVAFWDVSAPVTLDQVERSPENPFRSLIPRYDLILTSGGGAPVVSAYRRLGAQECVPIYSALDPYMHFPVPPDTRYEADLGFLGNHFPDREKRVDDLFFNVAKNLPARKFVLGGSGWENQRRPQNVRGVGHVYTRDHNAFNSTPRAMLNVSREGMARYGFSPPARLFESAGAGACLITDEWKGIELFFEPGTEVLIARNGAEVAEHLQRLTRDKTEAIGLASLRRALAEHTYTHRAAQVERVLAGANSIYVA